MSTTNGTQLYDYSVPPQTSLRILEYHMEVWWGPEANPDCIKSDHL